MAKSAASNEASKTRRNRYGRKFLTSVEKRAAVRKYRAQLEAAAKSSTDITIHAVDRSVGQVRSVRFGAVTVSNPVPDAQTLAHNIEAGRHALVRAKTALVGHGVKLHHRSGIAKYRVDKVDPRVLIRELDGRIERGRIVNGTFVTAE